MERTLQDILHDMQRTDKDHDNEEKHMKADALLIEALLVVGDNQSIVQAITGLYNEMKMNFWYA